MTHAREYRLAARFEPRQDVARAYENAARELDILGDKLRTLRRAVVDAQYCDSGCSVCRIKLRDALEKTAI